MYRDDISLSVERDVFAETATGVVTPDQCDTWFFVIDSQDSSMSDFKLAADTFGPRTVEYHFEVDGEYRGSVPSSTTSKSMVSTAQYHRVPLQSVNRFH